MYPGKDGSVLMSGGKLCTFALANFSQGLAEPGGVDFERFATFDAWEFYGAQDEALVIVMADDAGFTAESALNSQVSTGLDEPDVFCVCGGGSGEIT